MFKIQKLSLITLVVSAVISGNALANTDAKFNDEASYAVGVLLGSNVKQIVESQKGIIEYDNTRLLAGVQDVLNGKVNLDSNEQIAQTLQRVQEKMQQAQAQLLADIAKQAKQDGDQYRQAFEKKRERRKPNLVCYIALNKQGQEIRLSQLTLLLLIIPANSLMARYLTVRVVNRCPLN